jgi:hypothetical protein
MDLDAHCVAIEHAIECLCTGLLKESANVELRHHVQKGDAQKTDFYRQIVRVVYRILIWRIFERRDVLLICPSNDAQSGLVPSIDVLLEQSLASQDIDGVDLWEMWQRKMTEIEEHSIVRSFLWSMSACSLLRNTRCSNSYLVDVMGALNTICSVQLPDTEVLGAVYESLLELHPQINEASWTVTLSTKEGHARKATGSYYTPIPLVDRLLESTLEPMMNKVIHGQSPSGQERALLALRICDPSCGSGYFLVAAARRLATRLAQIRSGSLKPTSGVVQIALREVVGQCIYGVDINPMSVELCKVALWILTAESGKALPFLDAQIQCGNALLGIQPDQMDQGIQTIYFTLVKQRDERSVRNRLTAKNRREIKQNPLIQMPQYTQNSLVEMVRAVHAVDDGTLDGAIQKQAIWQDFRHHSMYQREMLLADTLVASMVWPKVSEDNWEESTPTHGVFQALIQNEDCSDTVECVKTLKEKHRFFHWHLAFPMVHAEGGFDLVIGNPPYLDSEFLSKHLPYQRTAMTHLYKSTEGNWDLYIPFTELGIRLLKPRGLHAFVTPNKILGAKYAAALQSKILLTQQIREVHNFSNLSLFSGASVAVVIVVTERTPVSLKEEVVFCRYDMDPLTPNVQASSTSELLSQLPAGFISFPVTSVEPDLLSWMSHSAKIKDVSICSDGATTGEAYEIREILCAGELTDWDDPSKIKLVNTGSIDPFTLLWAQNTTKYLGFSDRYPVIDTQTFQSKFPRRYQQTMQDTVVMAGMSNQLEAVVAPKGVLCGKSAVLIQPNEGICPYALTTLLNSEAYSNLYRGIFGMRAMSPQALNIGPREVEQLPIPDSMYLESFSGLVKEGMDIEKASTVHTRLSLLGKILHQYPGSAYLDLVDPLVRELMTANNGSTDQ